MMKMEMFKVSHNRCMCLHFIHEILCWCLHFQIRLSSNYHHCNMPPSVPSFCNFPVVPPCGKHAANCHGCQVFLLQTFSCNLKVNNIRFETVISIQQKQFDAFFTKSVQNAQFTCHIQIRMTSEV